MANANLALGRFMKQYPFVAVPRRRGDTGLYHVQEAHIMIDYRAATLQDAPALSELGRTSFIDAFGHLYSADNLNRFLEQAYSQAAVQIDLANPLRLYRIAEQDGLLVGYCKIGFDVTLEHEPGDRRVMELKQLYMRGNQTGSGIGATLMAWVLDEARAREFDDVILSVWSENHGAQRFYARHGFGKIGDTVFMVGDHRDEDYLRGLRLR